MTIFVRRLLPLVVVFAYATASYAQAGYSAPSKISGDEVRSDLIVLRDTLRTIHPGLYRYRSKVALDKVFDSCFTIIRDSMTIPEAYLLVDYLIASIEDGHANARLPKPILDDYYNHVGIFPAELFFIHNRAYIFCCKQKPGLAEAEVLSINGVDMGRIIRKLFAYIPSDGAIESRKNWEMPDNFPFLYNEVYGRRDSFVVTYKSKSGIRSDVVLKADLVRNMLCGNALPRPKRYLTLEYKGDVAVLIIRSFFDGFLQQTGENFGSFLDSAFTDIHAKKVRHLLIDLRSNQGGNDGNGELLYAYLTRDPFRYYTSQETTKGKFPEEDHPNLGMQKSRLNHYEGKVYFLTNGRSFSATAEFAAIARSSRRGIFIGEETGGGYYGNISGDEGMITLPHSQITCRIPEVMYTMAVRKAARPDRGVIPDHIVYPTIADLVEGKDSQLAYALELISKGNE